MKSQAIGECTNNGLRSVILCGFHLLLLVDQTHENNLKQITTMFTFFRIPHFDIWIPTQLSVFNKYEHINLIHKIVQFDNI